MVASILVVDDESSVRNSLARVLRGNGYSVRVADSARAALGEARKADPDVVLLDVCLPDTSGLDILAELKQLNHRVIVIAMTAHQSTGDAVLAMKRGAYDYLSKPFNIDALRLLVKQALENTQAADRCEDGSGGPTCGKSCPNCSCPLRNKHAKAACGGSWQKSACEQMIGTSPAMGKVFDLIHRLPANAGSNVLIEGETGTGKELLARAVHELSSRAAEPFMAICSGAIPRDLLESELFGYEGGAYTGSKAEGKVGIFEAVAGGTIFLDEISELDSKLQVKLLRVLEAREFCRVGGTVRIPLRARLVAATNRHLKQEVDEGRFRADLYYRLNVLRITLPPLRERYGDVIPLAEAFLREFNLLFDKMFQSISPPARKLLDVYSWPGNVRELRNIIERIAIIETGDTIIPDHLPQEVLSSGAMKAHLPFAKQSTDFKLAQVEKDCIIKALQRTGGNVVNTARLLGIKRGALRYRMDRLGISKDDYIPRSPED